MLAHARRARNPRVPYAHLQSREHPDFGRSLARVLYSRRVETSSAKTTSVPYYVRPKVQLFKMPSRTHLRTSALILGLTLIFFCTAPRARAQDEDFDEGAPDPIKLVKQGRAAHARGVQDKSPEQFQLALEFYEQAIKLSPDNAEAEFLRGTTLVALERKADAEKAFRRAMELSPDWLLPPAALGELLVRDPARTREAEEVIRRAVQLDPNSLPLLYALAELRRRAGDRQGALEFLRRATADESATAAMWIARAELEKETNDTASALKSLTRAITIDPANPFVLYTRAGLYIAAKDFEHAAKDLQSLEEFAKTDPSLALNVAAFYARMDDKTNARRIIESMPEPARSSREARGLVASLTEVDCVDTPEAREALERRLLEEPNNASLYGCLGSLYRTTDPPRSLAYWKRAAEIDQSSVKYVTGYASALIQLRRFQDAAVILDRILKVAPDDYTARANFATALYELKLYKPAIAEYNWMLTRRPELAIIQFFIGTAHDHLEEYPEALVAYEAFLARADAQVNQLEIDKVKLRLPSLRNQIKRGEGVKKKG